MRARLEQTEQQILGDVQAHMERMEYALRVDGTSEIVAEEAEAAASDLSRLSLEIRLRIGVRS